MATVDELLELGRRAREAGDQLRRDPEERTWEGSVAGIVPYDFRMPTLERARSRWWNSDDDRLFVPQVFGVGWTINLARLARLARPA